MTYNVLSGTLSLYATSVFALCFVYNVIINNIHPICIDCLCLISDPARDFLLNLCREIFVQSHNDLEARHA